MHFEALDKYIIHSGEALFVQVHPPPPLLAVLIIFMYFGPETH